MDDPDNIQTLNLQFNFEPELRQAVHRDWGIYYKRLNRFDVAQSNFEESLELSEGSAYRPFIEKSKCLLEKGKPAEALSVAEKCINEFPNRLDAQDHRNNCIYELNQFEKSLVEAYRTYHRNERARDGKGRIDLIDNTIMQSIGSKVGPCLNQMRKRVQKWHDYELSRQKEDRPAWEPIKEEDCDVVSVKEETSHKIMTKIQKIKQRAQIKSTRSYYFNASTADDISFLESLRTDKRLILPQTPHSNEQILNAIDVNLTSIKKCEEMMWHRKPLYAKIDYKDQGVIEKGKRERLMRLKEQCRVTAFKQLNRIKKLSSSGNHQQLLDYVEEIMYNFYERTTKRAFPRKFEFMNEIYNIVGLSLLEKYKIPKDITKIPQKDRLQVILDVPPDKKNDERISQPKTFGSRDDFIDPEATDTGYQEYKKKIDYYDSHLLNSSCRIEKCFIYYQMARVHLNQRVQDESRQLGRRMISEAKHCGNIVWQFHGIITMIKVDVAQGNLNKIQHNLREAEKLIENVDQNLLNFVRTALTINERDQVLSSEK